jgi:DNA-binding transcriptional regulator YiaG
VFGVDKTMNKSNNISMILSEAHDVGINFQTLGDELGVARTTVSNWKVGNRSPQNPKKVISAVQKKCRYLQHLIIKETADLDDVRRELGFKEAKLAEILGVSRQWLNYQKQEGFEPGRLKEIQAILRGIGDQLDKVVRKYS